MPGYDLRDMRVQKLKGETLVGTCPHLGFVYWPPRLAALPRLLWIEIGLPLEVPGPMADLAREIHGARRSLHIRRRDLRGFMRSRNAYFVKGYRHAVVSH